MKNLISNLIDLITMPFISVAILIHESREVNKEERLARKYRKCGKYVR